MSRMSVERRGSPCLDGPPATQLCQCGQGITPCSQYFYRLRSRLPVLSVSSWTVPTKVRECFFIFFQDWLPVAVKVVWRICFPLLVVYIRTAKGQGKMRGPQRPEPRAKRRVFFQDPRSVVRLRTPCPLPTGIVKFLESSKLVKGTSSLICFVRPNARAPFH